MIAVESTRIQSFSKRAQPLAAPARAVAQSSHIRLLKFLALFGIGGTERQVVNLIRMLDRTRFTPSFGCLKRWGHFLGDIEQQRIHVEEYPISKLYMPSTLRQQLRLAQDMKRDGVQIFHSYNFYANVFAVPAARFAGVPVVIASIRDTGLGITPAKLRLHNLVCRLADCVLVNAEAVRQWLIGLGHRPDKIAVIHNGLDPAAFAQPQPDPALRRELGVPAGAPLVIVLARLVPSKGIESFIEAASAVNRRFPEARFLIAGDLHANNSDGSVGRDGSYMESLQRLATSLGIGDRVIFTGFRSDVPELLAHATVSVLPSLSGEGLPNALMESMAAGVPVVATRVGGSAEVVGEDGNAGLMVPPGDPRALSGAMFALLEDAALARRFGQAARSRMREHFSLEHMVRQTENLYADMLDRALRHGRKPGTRSRR
ncbi:MAG TPA: glycosyltransferase [Gammaproteobacteria bacterium]|nr:glycosyltransferase [Gammaproteobacteria bacterium]